MAVELNVNEDFAQVTDGLEAVMLRRRGSTESVAIDKAWRFSGFVDEPAPPAGQAVRHDVVWQFSWEDAVDSPRLGDAIVDAAGNCWTILSIEERGARTRLRCRTRELRIANRLDAWVNIERAEWDDPGGGLEIDGWRSVRAAVPARIVLEDVQPDEGSDPPTSTATYRVLIDFGTELLTLDHNHRLVGPDGVSYTFAAFAQAARLDALPEVTVTRTLPAE